MAELLGEDFHNVNRWVRGKAQPPHDFLLKVADVYGYPLEWLYGRDAPQIARQDEAAPAWARRLEARLSRLERMAEMQKEAEPVWARQLTNEVVDQIGQMITGAGLPDETSLPVLVADRLAKRLALRPTPDAGPNSGGVTASQDAARRAGRPKP
jgi:transcriptional regulator with XRE-family HTH domain